MPEACRLCSVRIQSTNWVDVFGLFPKTFLGDPSCYLADL
jgi:hypothetical protein